MKNEPLVKSTSIEITRSPCESHPRSPVNVSMLIDGIPGSISSVFFTITCIECGACTRVSFMDMGWKFVRVMDSPNPFPRPKLTLVKSQ